MPRLPGSPPANEYVIPVQAGRKDAAPRGTDNNPAAGSLYRSNNNFGSSTVVPGAGGGGNGPGSGPGGGAAGGGSGSGSGGGTSSAAATGLDVGNPSTFAAYTTLPLIILMGGLIGVAAARSRRRNGADTG